MVPDTYENLIERMDRAWLLFQAGTTDPEAIAEEMSFVWEQLRHLHGVSLLDQFKADAR